MKMKAHTLILFCSKLKRTVLASNKPMKDLLIVSRYLNSLEAGPIIFAFVQSILWELETFRIGQLLSCRCHLQSALTRLVPKLS